MCIDIVDLENKMAAIKIIENNEDVTNEENEVDMTTDNDEVVQDTSVDETMTKYEGFVFL